jgi:hypothetical protein
VIDIMYLELLDNKGAIVTVGDSPLDPHDGGAAITWLWSSC